MPRPPVREPPYLLEFATNSLRNTTVSVPNDELYYEIVTRFWHPTLTKIFKLDPETRDMNLIAEIDRVEGRAPRLRFGGEQGRWIEEEEFLKWNGATRDGAFTDGRGVEYRWKSHHRRLQLVRGDGAEDAVADFHKHRRHFGVWRMSKRAYIEVKPEMNDSLDQLILSFLLISRKRRDTKRALRFERS